MWGIMWRKTVALTMLSLMLLMIDRVNKLMVMLCKHTFSLGISFLNGWGTVLTDPGQRDLSRSSSNLHLRSRL